MASKIEIIAFILISAGIMALLTVITYQEFGIWSALSLIGSGIFSIVYIVFTFFIKSPHERSHGIIVEIF